MRTTPAFRGPAVLLLTLLALLALAALPVQAQAADSTTWIQRNLAGLNYLAASGVDGVYGSQTTTAVRGFQHDNGLDEDGVYGGRTELALHNKVIEVQRKAGSTADGAYGSGTSNAVAAWQSAHSLTADGITGPATMNAMGIARTVRLTAQWKFGRYGWSVSGQFGCLDQLWIHESEWKVYADNPMSDAYGIPQALPGSKMSTAGGDWQTNPATQIQWGLDYINGRYGTPCSAWSFWQSHNWY
ncbi:peptidoglycan-binding protein [Streptomyces sp. H10-C2]|uniref:peptidoglycan-binding domain-containing protein n=1 Tax=unclassified Streptomyces TaxID=2593676 RepID=UPI0024BB46E6|nr:MULTISPECIES: peptidoglycan-binding protein [unclassified Streptomyces]MDJ0343809.1 peptidoglycan-binding protein [Streptomyces sp. PH10-H1]MDJ0373398.1 peptidoglycan-binding protein [Streptomyces sp. H10-C2]